MSIEFALFITYFSSATIKLNPVCHNQPSNELNYLGILTRVLKGKLGLLQLQPSYCSQCVLGKKVKSAFRPGGSGQHLTLVSVA